MIETKRCSLCGKVKPVEEFHRAANRPGGRQARCAECTNTVERENRRKKNQSPRKTFPELKDKAWVEQKYLVECLSIIEIAALVGCTHATASKTISLHKIPRRPPGVQRALRAGREARGKVRV